MKNNECCYSFLTLEEALKFIKNTNKLKGYHLIKLIREKNLLGKIKVYYEID